MDVKPLKIAQLGNPVLRNVSGNVEKFDLKTLQRLIDNLIYTLNFYNGVGLAAPQVNHPIRLCIIASHPNPRYPDAPTMEPTPMINPQIRPTSTETVKDYEGCLSIPGIRAAVPRYSGVRVSYSDRYGQATVKNYSGFIARIIQHECDHLDGLVFLDRTVSSMDIITEIEYQKLLHSRKNRP